MISSSPLANARSNQGNTAQRASSAEGLALPLAISLLEAIPAGLLYILFSGPTADASPVSSLFLLIVMLGMLLYTGRVHGAASAGASRRAALFTRVVGYGIGLLPLLFVSVVFALPLYQPLGSPGTTSAAVLDVLCFSGLYARCIFIAEAQTESPERLHAMLFVSMRVGFGVSMLTLFCALGGFNAAALLPAIALALPISVLSSFWALGLAQHIGLRRTTPARGRDIVDSRQTWAFLLGRVAPVVAVALVLLEYLSYYAILGQLAAVLNAMWFGITTFVSWLLWPLRWLWQTLTHAHSTPLQPTPTPVLAQRGTPIPGLQGGTPGPGGQTPGPGSGTPGLTGTPSNQNGTPVGQGQATGTPIGQGSPTAAAGTASPGPGTGTPLGRGTGTPGPGTGTPLDHGGATPGPGIGTPGTGTPVSSISGPPGNGTPAGTPVGGRDLRQATASSP